MIELCKHSYGETQHSTLTLGYHLKLCPGYINASRIQIMLEPEIQTNNRKDQLREGKNVDLSGSYKITV